MHAQGITLAGLVAAPALRRAPAATRCVSLTNAVGPSDPTLSVDMRLRRPQAQTGPASMHGPSLLLLFHLLLPLLLHALLHLLVHLLLHLQEESKKIYSISGRIYEG